MCSGNRPTWPNDVSLSSIFPNVVVTAHDSAGNKVSATFNIVFEEPQEDGNDQIGSSDEPDDDVPSGPQTFLHDQPESFDAITDKIQQGVESSGPSEVDVANFIAEQEKDMQNIDTDGEVAAGKASLIEQIQRAGHFGYQQDRNELLTSLMTLFSDAA